MKRTFTKWLTAVLAAVLVLALMGCGGNGDDEKDGNVKREFNDLTFLGKNVKLIDQTGNAKDLKARGIMEEGAGWVECVFGNSRDGTWIEICPNLFHR